MNNKLNEIDHVFRARFFIHFRKYFSRFLVTALLVMPQSTWATTDTSMICDRAAQVASATTGVPLAVLQAISLTETGRKSGQSFRPWPWTVNMEGRGEWFDSRDQAQSFANQNFQRGARSFDVGCFQLNYKWHGRAFDSIEHMFDPDANATYAANFLRDLYQEMGNWPDAAGAYHSRTPSFANRYKRRFTKIYARLSADPLPILASVESTPIAPAPLPPPATPIIARLNNFPLLQGGSAAMASLGSLMPASAGIGKKPLFGGS